MWRRLQDVIAKCLPKTSSRRPEDIFRTPHLQDAFARHLQKVFKTSSSRRHQDVFKKTSCNYVLKTSWKTKNVTLKTSSRRLQYVFTKTNVCCVFNRIVKNLQCILKGWWKYHEKTFFIMIMVFLNFFLAEKRSSE